MSSDFINILGKKVNVREFDDNVVGDSAMGRCNVKNGEITLNRNMPPDTKSETLLHEVIHYLNNELAIGLEEKQIQAVSSSLFCFFENNGMPFKYVPRIF